MKRSEIIREIKSIIATCGPTQPTIDTAIQVLDRIEKLGFRLVEVKDYGYDGSELEAIPYEPEEGWDAYFAEQDRKEQLRDFKVVNFLTERVATIANKFLQGQSFEELAQEYTVTRERIRQIVAKARRAYQRGEE